MKKNLKIISVIIGSLIGAGFASGQEIYLFFFSYGIKGLVGIIISNAIIGVIIYKTFIILSKNKISNYEEFLNNIIKNNKIKSIINKTINGFILVTFYIMVAGFGAYFAQEFKVSGIIGSSVLALLCYMVLKGNTKGFIKANELLIPILIIFFIIIGCVNIPNINIGNIEKIIIEQHTAKCIISSILYASYNSILLIPILITLKDYIKKQKDIRKISIISSLIMLILAIIIFFTLINLNTNIQNLEMPAVEAVNVILTKSKFVYGLIILISIFTTAVSLGASFLNNVVKDKGKYNIVIFFICLSAVFFSKIGFSNLVAFLYPFFGYLGLVQVLVIL